MKPDTTAIRTKGATFRLILTDHRGRVTEQTAGSYREWLERSNKALHAHQFDPLRAEGKSSTERRQPRYVRCESVCVLPSGEEVRCGVWKRGEPVERVAQPQDAPADNRLFQALLAATR